MKIIVTRPGARRELVARLEPSARGRALPADRDRALGDEPIDVPGTTGSLSRAQTARASCAGARVGPMPRVAAIGRRRPRRSGGADLVPAVSTQEGLLAELPRPAGRVLSRPPRVRARCCPMRSAPTSSPSTERARCSPSRPPPAISTCSRRRPPRVRSVRSRPGFRRSRSARRRRARRARPGSRSSPRPPTLDPEGLVAAVAAAPGERAIARRSRVVDSQRPVFITFLTDFGLQDDFVGTCHGVIKRIAPDAQIIDITHGIPPQAVLQGALVLANTLPYMPVGVHLAVVDPGVGGHRRALALRDAEGRLFVGPGQRPAAAGGGARGNRRRSRAREPRLRARVDLAHLPRPRPVRARRGASRPRRADRRARPADRPRGARAARAAGARRSSDGVVQATTLYVDSFGNIALNLTRDDLDHVGVVPGTRVELDLSGRALLRCRGAHVRRCTPGRRDPLRGQLPATCRSRSRTGTRRRCCAPSIGRPLSIRIVCDVGRARPGGAAVAGSALGVWSYTRDVGGAGLRPRRLFVRDGP